MLSFLKNIGKKYVDFVITEENRAMIGYRSNIEHLVIPATFTDANGVNYRVVGIDAFAFFNRKNLKSVVIPNGVRFVGEYAFSGCTELTVQMPESMKSVGNFACSGCKNVIANLCDDVIRFGTSAFKDVEHLYYKGTASVADCGAISIN